MIQNELFLLLSGYVGGIRFAHDLRLSGPKEAVLLVCGCDLLNRKRENNCSLSPVVLRDRFHPPQAEWRTDHGWPFTLLCIHEGILINPSYPLNRCSGTAIKGILLQRWKKYRTHSTLWPGVESQCRQIFLLHFHLQQNGQHWFYVYVSVCVCMCGSTQPSNSSPRKSNALFRTPWEHALMCAQVHAHKHTQAHTCTHKLTQTHTCTHMHAHTHIQAHTYRHTLKTKKEEFNCSPLAGSAEPRKVSLEFPVVILDTRGRNPWNKEQECAMVRGRIPECENLNWDMPKVRAPNL